MVAGAQGVWGEVTLRSCDGRVPVVVQWVNDPVFLCGSASSIPGQAEWVKSLVLPQVAAEAWIQSLACELPYATDAAIKNKGKY